MLEKEKKERLDAIQMCKDCFNLFKLEFNEQIFKVESGRGMHKDLESGKRVMLEHNDDPLDLTNTSRIDSHNNMSRMQMNGPQHYENEKNETVSAFMMDEARDMRLR